MLAWVLALSVALIGGASARNALAGETASASADMSQWITNVGLQYKNDGKWNELTDGTTLTQGTPISFDMSWTIPAGGLVDANGNPTTSMKYQLGKNISIDSKLSGRVFEGGEPIGTYVIDTDGTITIDYYPEFAKKNWPTDKGGDNNPIDGELLFEGSAQMTGSGENEDFQLPIGDGQTITIHEQRKYDLKVSKKVVSRDAATGKVVYSIVVTSKWGTPQDVTLNDVMTGSGSHGQTLADLDSFTIVDKDGNEVAVSKPQEGAGDFSLTLPKMEAGQRYTITYTAAFADFDKTADISGRNTVSASSGDKYSDDASAKVSFDSSKPDISKTAGALDGDGNRTWTVTVNSAGSDVGGWTLRDVLGSGMSMAGKDSIVTIATSDGTSFTTALPYTFGTNAKDTNTKAQYTITYSTRFDGQAANETNKAFITPPGDSSGSCSGKCVSTGDVVVPQTGANKLEKTGQTIPGSDTGTTIDYLWTAKIDAGAASITGPWTFTDTLSDGTESWYGAKQAMLSSRSELQQAVLDAFKAAGIAMKADDLTITVTDSGFTVASNTTIPQGTVISFRYRSRATLPNKNLDNADWIYQSGYPYWNTITLGKLRAAGSMTYKPVKDTEISKLDDTYGHSWDMPSDKREYQLSNVPYYTDSNGTRKRVLSWRITSRIRTGSTNVSIVEQLPKGMSLLQGPQSVYFDNSTGTKTVNGLEAGLLKSEESTGVLNLTGFVFNGGTGTASIAFGNEFYALTATIGTSDGRQTVTISLPDSLVAAAGGATYHFEVRAVIDQGQFPDNALIQHEYDNTATIRYTSGGKESSASASQQQNVYSDGLSNLIAKQGKAENDNNRITYTVTVNPDARCLTTANAQTGGTCAPATFTVKDEATYSHYGSGKQASSSQDIVLSLVPGSVKVYEITSGCKKPGQSQCVALDSTAYSQTYTSDHSDPENYKEQLSLELANGKGYLISYTYEYSGKSIGSKLVVNNAATVLGRVAKRDGLKASVKKHAAVSTAIGLSVYKVNKENKSEFIAGAEFSLYGYTANGGWELLSGNIVSGADGKLGGYGAGNLTYNRAYKLVETGAPSGWTLNNEPFYFVIIPETNASNYPTLYPTDAESQKDIQFVQNDNILYFTNTRESISLPATGGSGAGRFIAGGLLLTAVACLGLIVVRKASGYAGRGGER